MSQLGFPLILTRKVWIHIPVEDPRAAALYDRHYSRQTKGAKGVLAAGWRFLLWHEGDAGNALWGVVYGRFRGRWRWRNSVFRNESGTLSSELVRAATVETYELWERRYKELPSVPLETEIDIAATARRRSKRSVPGKCYAVAGWEWVRSTLRGHGRSVKAIYRAPEHALAR